MPNYEVFYFKRQLLPEHWRRLGECDLLKVPEQSPFFLLWDDRNKLVDQLAAIGLSTTEISSLARTCGFDEMTASLSAGELNSFCRSLVAGSRSVHTWRARAYAIDMFLRWCSKVNINWKDIRFEDMQQYYVDRVLVQDEDSTERAISAHTWNAAVAALTRLYKWAVNRGFVQKLPFEFKEAQWGRIDGKTNTLTERQRRRAIRYVTLQQYKIFREALLDTRNGHRNRTLANFLVSTGLRISEALGLYDHELPDPDASRYIGSKSINWIVPERVTKLHHERTISIPISVLRLIEHYKEEDRENFLAGNKLRKKQSNQTEKFLWLTERATALQPGAVESAFKVASEKSKVYCRPHMLRHTFAIYFLDMLIRRVMDIKDLRKHGKVEYMELLLNPLQILMGVLGHRNPQTTFIYLDILLRDYTIGENGMVDWVEELLSNEEV